MAVVYLTRGGSDRAETLDNEYLTRGGGDRSETQAAAAGGGGVAIVGAGGPAATFGIVRTL